MKFDPSSPSAARWRSWLDSALGERGLPSDAVLELRTVPLGEAPMTRLVIDLYWSEPNAPRHACAEVLVPLHRMVGCGWSGWPGYLAAVKLLRALD